MALAETTTFTGFRPLHYIVAAGEAVLNGLAAIAEASPRYKKLQYLNSLSDAELAELGMKREDIAARVLGGNIWV